MQQIKNFIIIITMLFGLTIQTQAQSTATASSEASMIIPISIVKTVDINFGELAASATAGTVEFGRFGLILTGGVTVSPTSPGYTNGEFLVSGEPNHAFTVNSPHVPIVLTGSISGTMIVENLQPDTGTPEFGGGMPVLDEFGESPLAAIVKLYVGVNQPAGVYTNASDFYYTVNYE